MPTHGELHIEVIVEPSFQENGLLVWADGDAAAWLVDPGYPPAPDAFLAAAAQHKLRPEAILLTHCHVDHMAGVPDLCAALPDVQIWSPRDDAGMLTSAIENLSALMGAPVTCREADRLIAPGETLQLGALTWQVLDVAGHSPGGLAYYCARARVVLTGDALFAGSIGRYDFPGSSRERLLANIKNNLLTLPDDTVVYSGHGPTTTIGREKRHNMVLEMEFEE
jgi:hydroxyacylglutathione hydrolase